MVFLFITEYWEICVGKLNCYRYKLCLMVFSHQNKTTTKNVEPMHSYDAFHTRSGNDQTNMVRQRQDKRKLNHVHFLSCWTGEGEAAEVACWLPASPTQGGKVLQETVSAFPSRSGGSQGFSLRLSCWCDLFILWEYPSSKTSLSCRHLALV